MWKTSGISRTLSSTTDIRFTSFISLSTRFANTMLFSLKPRQSSELEINESGGQGIGQPRPIRIAQNFLVTQSCTVFEYYTGVASCWNYIFRRITSGNSFINLNNTVSRNVRWGRKRLLIIQVHTLTVKRRCAFANFVFCGLSKFTETNCACWKHFHE